LSLEALLQHLAATRRASPTLTPTGRKQLRPVKATGRGVLKVVEPLDAIHGRNLRIRVNHLDLSYSIPAFQAAQLKPWSRLQLQIGLAFHWHANKDILEGARVYEAEMGN